MPSGEITINADELIQENERRLNALLDQPDQVTGQGMEGHTEKIVIPDYCIPTQFVYPEVKLNPLYQEVLQAGSIAQFVSAHNLNDPDTPLAEKDVEDMLFFIRLQNDPAFAFAVCFIILYKETGEKRPFILRYAQRKLLWALERQRRAGKPIRLILLKARQWGGSTLVQLYIAWIQLFLRSGWNSVIVAQTEATSRRIKAMYSLALEHFPAFIFEEDQLKFSPKERSNSDFTITNESRQIIRDNVITVSSYEKIDAEAGTNIALAHFSEVALWRETPTKTPASVIRVIDGGMLELPLTLQVMESTARGRAGYFYDEWQEAKAGNSSREPLFIPFYEIEFDKLDFPSPDQRRQFAQWLIDHRNETATDSRTQEPGAYLYSLWLKGATLEHINLYIYKRKSYHDHAHIASEMPSDDIECFMYSGNLIFNPDILEQQRHDYLLPPTWQGDITLTPIETIAPTLISTHTDLLIWKHPPTQTNYKDRYLVTVDLGGRSDNADYSVITVFDRWSTRIGGQLEVVARWRGHLRYDLVAWKAVAIATYYLNALLVFESNTFDKKKSEAADYIDEGDHIRGVLSTIGDTYANLYMRPVTDEESIRDGIYQKIGFQTNRKTKQDIVDAYIVAFEENHIIDHDQRYYEEAAIYEQREDGSYGNIPGRNNHDDILMTNMIGYYIHQRMPAPKRTTETKVPKITNAKPTLNESSLT